MNFKLIAVAIAFTAVAGLQGAQGQGCGCGGGAGFGASAGDIYSGVIEGGAGGYGSFGLLGFRGVGGGADCGRGISTNQASSLWAGYCTDNCAYTGPTHRGRHGCKLRHGGGYLSGGGHGGGFGGCGSGCGGGCFGYPNGGAHSGGIAASGCGCGAVAAVRGGLHCKHNARKAARGGHGLCKHGCKKRHGCKKCRHSMAQVECSSCLSGACDTCGTGGYFDAFVGYEYGNGGMQSCVSGCLTGACGCGG